MCKKNTLVVKNRNPKTFENIYIYSSKTREFELIRNFSASYTIFVPEDDENRYTTV